VDRLDLQAVMLGFIVKLFVLVRKVRDVWEWLNFMRVSTSEGGAVMSRCGFRSVHYLEAKIRCKNAIILSLTVYMHISDMLGVVETPLMKVLMNTDTSLAEEAVGSASRWSGSISGPLCGQICTMGKTSHQKESVHFH